ncbi:uncharacterized protein EAE98_008637 [Botrytis deweyae]|uniref:Uncharacterized protein n=2 Tax=Botrytis TaxID=33196 RepID=A0A4Z1JWE9_9HELO|nr:uncharacterized protein EAE98_008637 [Botrytis deweyae]KAF7921211.1 hypothetical protein EAE98_008637 [Botrytis deweyae]KAF7941504.1 hypothetical protein EAE99_001141 [Botrytis elliptica]TGO75572.1 hypothetical protein BELL_0205g00020 [Botrytis elliptica]
MQTNYVIGVIVIALMAFMILFGMGIYYSIQAIQRRRSRRAQLLAEPTISGTQGTRSLFSSLESSHQWSQESRSSSSTQSHSTPASSQWNGRRHRPTEARPKRSHRLPNIVEEWPNEGSRGISPEDTSQGTAESPPQLEPEMPGSYNRYIRPSIRQVGLGNARVKERLVHS